MTTDDVRVLADELLMPTLGPVGFTSAEVEEGQNYAGEDAFFVKVRFAPGSLAATGRVYNDALWTLWSALQKRGEKRFAHLLWAYEDDEIGRIDRETDGDGA